MNDKENTEPQKPFNDHTPLPWDHQVCENRDPFGSSISHDLHHEDGDGFSFVAEFSNEDDAMFARHACNTYYDTIAARSKDKERIEALQASLLDVAEKSTARIAALEAAGDAMARLSSLSLQLDGEACPDCRFDYGKGHTAGCDIPRVEKALSDWSVARALLNQQPTPER